MQWIHQHRCEPASGLQSSPSKTYLAWCCVVALLMLVAQYCRHQLECTDASRKLDLSSRFSASR